MGHQHRFHVFFGDCDPAGIVFYPRFFVWFDNTFGDWTRERQLSQQSLRNHFGFYGTPIVDARATFRAPARCDDELSIQASVSEWKERSFRVAYQATRGDVLVAEGYEVRVCVARDDRGEFRAVSIPQSFKEALA